MLKQGKFLYTKDLLAFPLNTSKPNKKREELKAKRRRVECTFTRTSTFLRLKNLEIFAQMLKLNFLIPSSALSRTAESYFRLLKSF